MPQGTPVPHVIRTAVPSSVTCLIPMLISSPCRSCSAMPTSKRPRRMTGVAAGKERACRADVREHLAEATLHPARHAAEVGTAMDDVTPRTARDHWRDWLGVIRVKQYDGRSRLYSVLRCPPLAAMGYAWCSSQPCSRADVTYPKIRKDHRHPCWSGSAL